MVRCDLSSRSKHSPPRNSAATEREVFEIFLVPAHVKADGDDENEIEQQNRTIDGESAVHIGGYLATDEQR